MSTKHMIIHTDGGARGNPGPAAIGAVIESDGQIIQKIAEYIGPGTNNQAEYQAVHSALAFAAEHGATSVDVFSDSELIVRQLRGEYKVKNKELGPWFIKIQSLVNRIGRVTWHAIPREKNVMADMLVNQVLDEQVGRP